MRYCGSNIQLDNFCENLLEIVIKLNILYYTFPRINYLVFIFNVSKNVGWSLPKLACIWRHATFYPSTEYLL